MESTRRFRHRALRMTLAITLASLCGSGALHAQSPAIPEPKTPTDWLTRAAALSDIRAPGSAPFTLRGQFMFTDAEGGQKPVHGTYRLDWESATRWREEIVLPDFTRIRVGVPGNYWEYADHYPPPMLLSWLDTLLDFASRLRSQADWQPAKIHERKSGQESFQCVEMKAGPMDSSDLCFDSATNLLGAELPHVVAFSQGSSNLGRRAYQGSLAWTGKLFPRELIEWPWGADVLDFVVSDISPLESGEPTLFDPPAGAEQWVHCDQPTPTKLVDSVAPQGPPLMGSIQNGISLYGVIEIDGRLSHLAAVGPALPPYTDEALRTAALWKYSPPTCHGQPYREGIYLVVKFQRGVVPR